MSAENVEVVRQSFEACNRHDADEAVSDYHPEVEYRWAVSLDNPLVARGRDAVKEAFSEIWTDWKETLSTPLQLLDLGDQVLVEFTDRRVGRDGIWVEDNASEVWTFRDGLVVLIENFDSWDEALAAVGLE